jgi:hypothetical protein
MASSYEKKVESLLKGIHYRKEVIMPNLYGAHTTPLRFDFGVYGGDGKLKSLIEVDGEYHFKPIRGKLALQRQKAFDIKKNSYCLARNIILIRVPYWKIDTLTFEELFTNQDFVVKNKFHNQILKPPI